MTDTRCVNPEYQLEVDTMMLEYVIYKAIDAHIQLLQQYAASHEPLANGASHQILGDKAASATRLTEIFDTLIKVFKHNHGKDALTSIARFDARIAQFLVLLNIWLSNRADPTNWDTPSDPSPPTTRSTQMAAMAEVLHTELLLNQIFRRNWLQHRTHTHNHTNQASCPDPQASTIPAPRPRGQPRISLAHHLLPQFMHLSSEFHSARAPRGTLQPRWTTLASQFMIQSAIEVLDASDLLSNGVEVARLALEECCAWGYVQRRRHEGDVEGLHWEMQRGLGHGSGTGGYDWANDELRWLVERKAGVEDDVWQMFYTDGKGDGGEGAGRDGQPQSSGEIDSWTSIRGEALDTVLATFEDILDSVAMEHTEEDVRKPVRYLRNHFRLSKFLADVAEFMQVQWRDLHSPGWYGRPVLVQIEEGGVQGLSEVEYEDFKRRAGIEGIFLPLVSHENEIRKENGHINGNGHGSTDVEMEAITA